MSNLNNENRRPTPEEINTESLFLDGYAMTASALSHDYPVSLSMSMDEQDITDRLADKLAENGWEYAGSGHFAVVYVKGGLAMKFGFKSSDTGAMYAAWCRANQGLPGVPEVYSMTKMTGCYVVLMRRYQGVTYGFCDASAEYEAIAKAVRLGTDTGSYPVASTGAAINKFFHGIVDFDLHDGNVMLDENGGFVITDPTSYAPCADFGGTSRYNSFF